MYDKRGDALVPTFWNEKKANWYLEAVRKSDYSQKVLEVIAPLLDSDFTLLDVGAGCGALSISLAKQVKEVTALEPSIYMLNCLKRESSREGVKNIRSIQSLWEEVALDAHDVILCANVPTLLLDPQFFVQKAESLANFYIIMIQGVGRENNKFFFRELFPLIFGKELSEKDDYLSTYSQLHRLNIFANIRIIEYNMDQEFKDMEEAYDFWKEYLNLAEDGYRDLILEFLWPKLKMMSNGRFLLPVKKKSAVIWWPAKRH